MKEESLRDDDNVFDVAFENQGGEAAEHTVSATDIKVCTTASYLCGQDMVAAAASSNIYAYVSAQVHSMLKAELRGAAAVQHMHLSSTC